MHSTSQAVIAETLWERCRLESRRVVTPAGRRHVLPAGGAERRPGHAVRAAAAGVRLGPSARGGLHAGGGRGVLQPAGAAVDVGRGVPCGLGCGHGGCGQQEDRQVPRCIVDCQRSKDGDLGGAGMQAWCARPGPRVEVGGLHGGYGRQGRRLVKACMGSRITPLSQAGCPSAVYSFYVLCAYVVCMCAAIQPECRTCAWLYGASST